MSEVSAGWGKQSVDLDRLRKEHFQLTSSPSRSLSSEPGTKRKAGHTHRCCTWLLNHRRAPAVSSQVRWGKVGHGKGPAGKISAHTDPQELGVTASHGARLHGAGT